jgi:hypothetical protein
VRKQQFHVFGCFILLVAAALSSGCENRRKEPPPASVRIGGRTWTVELATTRQQRYAGLSGRTSLQPDKGMLFIYPQPAVMKFCMRGCSIPIDIVYIGADGRVLNVYEMQVEPGLSGLAEYSSHLPARYALELAGGTIRQAGIKVGDAVEFTNVPPPSTAEAGP